MINEYYANIKGYENLYQISNYGTIKSVDKVVKNNNGYRTIKSRILTPQIDKKGYYRIGLTKDHKQKFYLVHRLVAETFIPNVYNEPIINHKNGNKLDNHISNLEWCTQQYNIQHAYNTGLKMGVSVEHKGIYNPNVKLNEQDVLNIIKDKKNGISIKDSYSKYKNKITFKGFENVWFGYTWKNFVEKVDDNNGK